MIESRCGVGCLSCQHYQEGSCGGCVNISTPFWGGVCKVKCCCEEKELEHCGVCGEFPCKLVAVMGVAQGFDPAPRLERLRQWAREQATV